MIACRHRILLCLATMLIAAFACSCHSDDRFSELDRIVADTSPYDRIFQGETNLLKHKLDIATTDSARFIVLQELFHRYRNFRIDSAMIVSKRLVQIARSLPPDSLNSAMMNYADALNKSGMSKVSIDVLDGIPRTDAVKENAYFYYLYHTAYLSLAHDNMDPQMVRLYHDKIDALKDTLLSLNTPGTAGYVSNLAGKLADDGNTDEAIRQLTYLFYDSNNTVNPRDKAALEFQLAEIYLQDGDTTNAIDLLVKSSVVDLMRAKKVYKSLQRLAVVLYLQGDVERAYKYITKSLNDINYGRARYRLPDIAEYLPIITTAYNQQRQRSQQQQVIAIVLLVLLACTSAGAFFSATRKKKLLSDTKRQLEEQNRQLQKLAEDLRQSNQSLEESNHIKVEYIASLFNICSDYIKKQEDWRKQMSRKLASNQIQEAQKSLKNSLLSDDFRLFINKFDAIFLSLFPDFVDRFNSLLRPEERIVLKKDELLTPELRIYALVRLGITENTKIADFLHYSLQTVYNYRQKMRNKAIDRNQKLSDRIKKFGAPNSTPNQE